MTTRYIYVVSYSSDPSMGSDAWVSGFYANEADAIAEMERLATHKRHLLGDVVPFFVERHILK